MKPWETLGVAVCLLAGLASCKVGRAADTAERVEEFETRLSEELGVAVKVVCPTMIDGHHHYCTALILDHEELAFPIRVTSRGDELDYTTKLWVSGARMVKLGKHALEEKLDIAVDSLTCPRISYMPDGTKVRCDAKAEGVDIPVEVSMVMKVRKLNFEPVGGVVFGDRAARAAHEELHEQGVHVEVTCPMQVLVSVPGKRFECQAQNRDETAGTIHYLVTSTDGTFELGTEPPPAGVDSAAGNERETAAADSAR